MPNNAIKYISTIHIKDMTINLGLFGSEAVRFAHHSTNLRELPYTETTPVVKAPNKIISETKAKP